MASVVRANDSGSQPGLAVRGKHSLDGTQLPWSSGSTHSHVRNERCSYTAYCWACSVRWYLVGSETYGVQLVTVKELLCTTVQYAYLHTSKLLRPICLRLQKSRAFFYCLVPVLVLLSPCDPLLIFRVFHSTNAGWLIIIVRGFYYGTPCIVCA